MNFKLQILSFTLASLTTALMTTTTLAEDASPKPVWELSEESMKSTTLTGTVALENGVVKLDGTNSISIPASVLGPQDNYTIEFEVKRPAETSSGHNLHLVSNTDTENETGLDLNYTPPAYNAGLLSVNSFQATENRGFLTEKAAKITIVAKDRRLTLFRDGLVLAMTSEVKPSSRPLTFGGVEKRPSGPYEFRNIKIYDEAIYPTGFDESAERMVNYSGDGYFMQRVEIKDPSLPRILVVGDSISMAYRRFITEHFKGKAYVDYWVGGGWFGETAQGEDSKAQRSWSGVLSNGPYDVVSWNAMTLHMWNGAPGRCDETTYPANMTAVVKHLQATAPDTKFIWVRCTPWRTTPKEGRPTLDPENNDRIVRLNAVTDHIMQEHGIPTIDLYALCLDRFDTIPDGAQDAVHWNGEVSKEMAELIIPEIEKQLKVSPK